MPQLPFRYHLLPSNIIKYYMNVRSFIVKCHLTCVCLSARLIFLCLSTIIVIIMQCYQLSLWCSFFTQSALFVSTVLRVLWTKCYSVSLKNKCESQVNIVSLISLFPIIIRCSIFGTKNLHGDRTMFVLS